MNDWGENELAELEGLVSGRVYPLLGVGFRTYPASADANQSLLQAGLEELERRNLVTRKIDEPDFILWIPVEETE